MEVADAIVAELAIEWFFNIQLVGDHVIEVNPRISTIVYQEDLNLPYLGVKRALGEIADDELVALRSRIRPGRTALRYFDQLEWDARRVQLAAPRPVRRASRSRVQPPLGASPPLDWPPWAAPRPRSSEDRRPSSRQSTNGATSDAPASTNGRAGDADGRAPTRATSTHARFGADGRPLRVTFCPVNTAGVPWTTVQALRTRGVDARLVVFNRYALHPEADRSLDLEGGLLRRQAKQWRELARLLPQTDVFHFVFGLTLVPQSLQFPILKAFGKKAVFHYLGSDIRGKTPGSARASARRPTPRSSGATTRSAGCPRPWSSHPASTSAAIVPSGPAPPRARPVVVHAPSSRERKGTDARDRGVRGPRRRPRHRRGPAPSAGVRALPQRRHHRRPAERRAGTGCSRSSAWRSGSPWSPSSTTRPCDAPRRRSACPCRWSTPRRRRSATRSSGSSRSAPRDARSIGSASRAYVERVHDLEHVTDQLLDLYATVREPKRPSPRGRPTRPRPSASDRRLARTSTTPTSRRAFPSPTTPLPMPAPARLASESSSRRLGRHSAIYGIGGLVSRVIAVLLLPLYTHYLTPRDYGKIETLLALTTVMGLAAAGRHHERVLPVLLRRRRRRGQALGSSARRSGSRWARRRSGS